VTNNGSITLYTDLTIPEGVTVTNNELIEGSTLLGEGTVVNNGSICSGIQDEAASPTEGNTVGLTVTGNAFYLPYLYPQGFGVGNNVYGPTMDEGCRNFPNVSFIDEAGVPQINVGWTLTEDGSGPFITDTTPLAEVVGEERRGTLHPTMVPAVLTIEPEPAVTIAGDSIQLTVTGPWPLSNARTIDLTDRVWFGPAEQFAGPDNGMFTATTSGEYDITATASYPVEADSVEVTTGTTLLVLPAGLDSLQVNPSATRVKQGDSITLDVTGTDEFGNTVPINPSSVVITSDVATDIINGLTVTFPTASPHTLTVTVGELSEQIVIEVEAAAVVPDPILADTGARDTTPLSIAALLLLTLGALLVLARRAPRTPHSS
jgi:hypothetical protein